MMVPEQAGDESLAADAVLGNRQAFDELVIRYQARMYRLACRLAGVDDAEDVVQEAFLSAFRHLGSFRRESKFSTWLYRIAVNAALMHRQARARQRADSLDAFLPTFEADGSHRGTPENLEIASRADELLDCRLLAE
jgi:RNA polymerase sigma-70 factor (ECF subfamily)